MTKPAHHCCFKNDQFHLEELVRDWWVSTAIWWADKPRDMAALARQVEHLRAQLRKRQSTSGPRTEFRRAYVIQTSEGIFVATHLYRADSEEELTRLAEVVALQRSHLRKVDHVA